MKSSNRVNRATPKIPSSQNGNGIIAGQFDAIQDRSLGKVAFYSTRRGLQIR